MGSVTRMRAALDDAAAFLLGERCAGCESAIATLCAACAASFEPVQPPRTAGGLAVASALAYRGVAARGIRALKAGRTSLARVFAAHVADVLAQADPSGALAIVPVPTSGRSYRTRGFRVPEALLRAAGAPAYRALATAGRPADQRGLSSAERAANVAGTIRMRRGVPAPGQALVFDDVYTTGATLDEAARVLRTHGCEVVGAVTLAHTPRRK